MMSNSEKGICSIHISLNLNQINGLVVESTGLKCRGAKYNIKCHRIYIIPPLQC